MTTRPLPSPLFLENLHTISSRTSWLYPPLLDYYSHILENSHASLTLTHHCQNLHRIIIFSFHPLYHTHTFLPASCMFYVLGLQTQIVLLAYEDLRSARERSAASRIAHVSS